MIFFIVNQFVTGWFINYLMIKCPKPYDDESNGVMIEKK